MTEEPNYLSPETSKSLPTFGGAPNTRAVKDSAKSNVLATENPERRSESNDEVNDVVTRIRSALDFDDRAALASLVAPLRDTLVTTETLTDERLEICLQFFKRLEWLGKPLDAKLIAQELFRISSHHSEDQERLLHAQCLLALGTSLHVLADFHGAEEVLLRALEIVESNGDLQLTSSVRGTLGLVYKNSSRYESALAMFEQAIAIQKGLPNTIELARHYGNLGNLYRTLGFLEKAVDVLNRALEIDTDFGNTKAMIRHLHNLGIAYQTLGDNSTAIEKLQRALQLAVDSENTYAEAVIYGEIGVIFSSQNKKELALEYFARSLELNKQMSNSIGIANNLACIGNAHQSLGNVTAALRFHNEALALHHQTGGLYEEGNDLSNIAIVHVELKQFAEARQCVDSARAIAEQIGSAELLSILRCTEGLILADPMSPEYDEKKAESAFLESIEKNPGKIDTVLTTFEQLAELYKRQERWRDYATYREKLHTTEISIRGEKAEQATILFDLHRRQSELEKQTAVEQAKLELTQELLHKVLPKSIVERMLSGSRLIADKHQSVSILFADIVNFTVLSQTVSPTDIVNWLDVVFTAFDELADKHRVEKIKTIGDAYMVVAGAPTAREDHAFALSNFAFELIDCLSEIAPISHGGAVQLRIGIHTGAVVAGVIGKKIFAYDIWGDAVNTASRMESHGEPGRIHVSEEFVEALSLIRPSDTFSHRERDLVENLLPVGEGRVRAIPRGEMEIKGKGIMRTFFLERLTEKTNG